MPSNQPLLLLIMSENIYSWFSNIMVSAVKTTGQEILPDLLKIPVGQLITKLVCLLIRKSEGILKD